jgi:hypothetical protein
MRQTPLLALLFLSGPACIAWRGDLARLEPADFAAPERPRALTFEAVYRANGEEQESESKDTTELLEGALAETGLFASVEPTSAKGELHLEFRYDETFDEGAVQASGFLCGFTFFLFPAIVEADCELEAVLYEHGVAVGSARHGDELHFAMEILLLPLTPFFWPGRVGDELVENLALHAVRDLLPGRADPPASP